jgi:hypothetical protein
VSRRSRQLFGLRATARLRGRRAQVVAAIPQALAFPTWRSLTRDQGLGNNDAVELMSRLVEDTAGSVRPQTEGGSCGEGE